jgi:hypothetical protein
MKLLIAIWFQCMVIIYIVVHFDRKVATPIAEWVERILR